MKAETMVVKALRQTARHYYSQGNQPVTTDDIARSFEYMREVMLEIFAAEKQRENAEEKYLTDLKNELLDPNS